MLFKVSSPRSDLRFAPRPFWRSEDWSFSDDEPRAGLIEDCVLFAAEFDEINLHLLPRVRRIRVWLDDAERSERLRACGFDWTPGSRALLFAADDDRAAVEAFAPTVFTFDDAGFTRTPTNEFVAREPRTAVSAETIPMADALARWHVEVVYVTDLEALEQRLRNERIDHQIQT